MTRMFSISQRFEEQYVPYKLGILLSMILFLVSACDEPEARKLRISEQYGLVYLPIQVAADLKLIEKHARSKGVEDLQVTFHKLGGASAAIDATLSESVDVAAGGIGPLIKIWAKTRGSVEVKGIMPLVRTPMYLNTNNPKIKSISDYTPSDKIAVPSVKSSIQAVVLQMASSHQFGEEHANKLDPMTVSMKHPDALVSIISGGSEPRSHFAILPFLQQELEHPGVRTILSSFDVLGGPHSQVAVWTTKKWKENNPDLFEAVFLALEEAIFWINANPKSAAELYIRVTNSKINTSSLQDILSDSDLIEFNSRPAKVQRFAEFLFKIGSIEVRPNSWNELFWERVHAGEGD